MDGIISWAGLYLDSAGMELLRRSCEGGPQWSEEDLAGLDTGAEPLVLNKINPISSSNAGG